MALSFIFAEQTITNLFCSVVHVAANNDEGTWIKVRHFIRLHKRESVCHNLSVYRNIRGSPDGLKRGKQKQFM